MSKVKSSRDIGQSSQQKTKSITNLLRRCIGFDIYDNIVISS